MRIHILGLNIFGINAFKLSKKKNFVTTISDIKKKNEFSNLKSFYNKNKKDIFFEKHPQKIIKKANLIVVTPGIIRSDKDLVNILKHKKVISEIDFFQRLSKWPYQKIIAVTGSYGKTTVCNFLKKKLVKLKKDKKIFFAGRANKTLCSLPKFKKNYFLISEIDYQLLAPSKNFSAKYNIITSLNNNANHIFKDKKLYFNCKVKLITNNPKKNFLITSKKTFQKIKKIKMKNTNIILKKNNINSKLQSKNLANESINIMKSEINYL